MAFNHAQKDGERRPGGLNSSLRAALLRLLYRVTSLLRRGHEKTRTPAQPSMAPEAMQNNGVVEEPLGVITVSHEEPAPSAEQPASSSHEQLLPPQPAYPFGLRASTPELAHAELPPIAEKPDPEVVETAGAEGAGMHSEQLPAVAEPLATAEAPQAAVQLEEGAALVLIPEEPKSTPSPVVTHEESNMATEPGLIPEISNATSEPVKTREQPRLVKAPMEGVEVPPKAEEPDDTEKEQSEPKKLAESAQAQEAREGKEAVVLIDLGLPARPRIPRRPPGGTEKSSSFSAPLHKKRERVESPYIEIDLACAGDDERTTHIIFPPQRLQGAVGTERASPYYDVALDGEKQQVPCRARIRDGCLELEETSLGLSHSIGELCIVFPREVGQRTYRYNHKWEPLFVFSTIGANRGRMLYDLTALPKRPVWILLDERYELLNVPDIEERQWVWERFKPYRVDLRQCDALQVKSKQTGETRNFTCRPSFKINGDQLVDDDFVRECPIVSGNRLVLESPYEDEVGWDVWIQTKTMDAVVVSRGWTGKEPLKMSLPPPGSACDIGEFQVDIWDPVDGRSDATVFFRWLPSLQLDYPRELQFPHPHTGHVSSTVTLTLRENLSCNVHNSREYLQPDGKKVYEIAVPADTDTTCVSVQNREGTMSPVRLQMSVPRLRWRIDNQEEWWSTPQIIAATDLTPGIPLDVVVSTNDRENRYDIDACLGRGAEQLQLGQFEQKGGYCTLGLNQFFDTIHNCRQDELMLRLDIRKKGEPQLLGTAEVLRFALQPAIKNTQLPHVSGIRASQIRRTLQRARIAYPNATQACELVLRHAAEQRGLESQAAGDFVVRGTALLKFIIDTLGPTKIKGHQRWSRRLRKRWSKRIAQVQRKCSDHFDAAYRALSQR